MRLVAFLTALLLVPGLVACRDCDCPDGVRCATDIQDSNLDNEKSSDTDDTPWRASFDFAVSNVDLEALGTEPADVLFQGAGCAIHSLINTDTCTVHCLDDLPCEVVTLDDGREIAVLVARRFLVAEDVVLELEGSRPLVIVATGEVDIRGLIHAKDSVYGERGRLGGGSSDATGPAADGHGPGGGQASQGDNGAGGGGYCGAGGAGGLGSSDLYPGSDGGAPYGNPELVPLLGGSAGGKGASQAGGAGGGAIQMSSAVAISVGEQGAIDMGGQGGAANRGNGGGSGGAILLEAPVIAVHGVLAANGGGGGAGDLHADGQASTASPAAALGGRTDTAPWGGDGSSQAVVDGQAGQSAQGSGDYGAGGGGGAGRIRLHTAQSGLTLTGVVSPGLDTGCATHAQWE